MKNLNEFIKEYCKKNVARFHVPGHQGRCRFLNKKLGARFDITEVKGADWLFNSIGVIKRLECNLAALIGQAIAMSTCGSTLCVQTMVYLCRKKIIIAHRSSAHVSFFNVCEILGVEVKWFGFNEQKGGLFEFSVVELKQKLEKFKKYSCAVYVTSPDYYGFFVPIKEILKLCTKFNALLLVDCAHGAHLNFTQSYVHPAKEGAHLSFSSLHKTLPALTGAAFLAYDDSVFSKEEVKTAMLKFSTTSPSYLTMASVDLCFNWLIKKAKRSFYKLQQKKEQVIKTIDLPVLKTDVCKLVINCVKLKISGQIVAEFLRFNKIEPEFANEFYVVLVLTPFLKKCDWRRLIKCCRQINKNIDKIKMVNYAPELKTEDKQTKLKIGDSKQVDVVAIEKAYGKRCAFTVFKNPPGTVLVYEGEKLNDELISKLKNQGYNKIKVLTV